MRKPGRQLIASAVMWAMVATLGASSGLAAASTVRGSVTSVATGTITLTRSIVIDISKARIERNGKPVPAGTITPGTSVVASVSESSPSAPGVLVADLVVLQSSDATLTGTIESAGQAELRIAGQTVTTNGQTFYGGFIVGQPVKNLNDVKVGVPFTVEVIGTSQGLLATSVIAAGPSPRAPVVPPANHLTITDKVKSIDGSVWTVGSTKVYTNSQTTISGSPVSGDMVVVSGLKTTAGAIIASSIRKKSDQ